MVFKAMKLDESTKKKSINIGEIKSKDEALENLMIRDLGGKEESARRQIKNSQRVKRKT